MRLVVTAFTAAAAAVGSGHLNTKARGPLVDSITHQEADSQDDEVPSPVVDWKAKYEESAQQLQWLKKLVNVYKQQASESGSEVVQAVQHVKEGGNKGLLSLRDQLLEQRRQRAALATQLQTAQATLNSTRIDLKRVNTELTKAKHDLQVATSGAHMASKALVTAHMALEETTAGLDKEHEHVLAQEKRAKAAEEALVKVKAALAKNQALAATAAALRTKQTAALHDASVSLKATQRQLRDALDAKSAAEQDAVMSQQQVKALEANLNGLEQEMAETEAQVQAADAEQQMKEQTFEAQAAAAEAGYNALQDQYNSLLAEQQRDAGELAKFQAHRGEFKKVAGEVHDMAAKLVKKLNGEAAENRELEKREKAEEHEVKQAEEEAEKERKAAQEAQAAKMKAEAEVASKVKADHDQLQSEQKSEQQTQQQLEAKIAADEKRIKDLEEQVKAQRGTLPPMPAPTTTAAPPAAEAATAPAAAEPPVAEAPAAPATKPLLAAPTEAPSGERVVQIEGGEPQVEATVADVADDVPIVPASSLLQHRPPTALLQGGGAGVSAAERAQWAEDDQEDGRDFDLATQVLATQA